MHRQECLFYVVPGAGAVTQDLARELADYARRGACIIFESAAGFGGFESQREMLAQHFGLQITCRRDNHHDNHHTTCYELSPINFHDNNCNQSACNRHHPRCGSTAQGARSDG